MGSATSQKSFLSKKVIILVVSLILTGVVMRYFSPAYKLDVRFYYTYEQAVSYLQGLTELQKQNYLYAELFDLWFLTNYTWLWFLALKKYLPNKGRLWIAFIPGSLDLFETGLILFYLLNKEIVSTHQLLPALSSLKWFFGFLIPLYLGGMIFWRRAKS
jgi:hypothetical protein